jgi:alkylation response protein AidB-like acyl-CoA dehydrogenase
VRDGDDWIVNGSKIFITNGLNSDATIVFCKTNPDAGHRGFSLLVVEDGMEGFKRGRKLKKIGMAGQDTAELFFEDVRVPTANLLGEEGQGFYYLMMNLGVERLAIALAALSQARQVFDDTLDYVKTREAFKQPIGTFQANKHVMATFATELDIAQVYVDSLIVKVLDGTLSDIEASKAKWWVTEVGKRVIDGCLQLHGGYGYMLEYPVAKAYIDYRYMTIGGGSTEIMKEMIGNDLGLAWRKRG